jgi:hypothetical protein
MTNSVRLLMTNSADSLNRKGVELFLQGDLDGAKLHYLAALKVDPGFIPPAANLVGVLGQQDCLVAALAHARQIIARSPDNGDIWCQIGNLLTRLERYDEAESALVHATELRPDNRNAWHNLGLLQYRMGNWPRALAAFDTVIALGGDSDAIRNDRAHVLLAMERLSEGLVDYEGRWKDLPHLPAWDFRIPEWTGQDLTNKSILLHSEQGFGDMIMTSRFWLDIFRLGAKVTLGTPESMIDLFGSQDWNIDILAIEAMNESNMRFDYQSPTYGAMRWLGIERFSIRSASYLSAPAISVPNVYRNTRNIGICWRSNNEKSGNWRHRVSQLSDWLPLAELPNVQLWSLCKNDSSREIVDLGAEALVLDLMPKLNTWGQTAAFVDKLDMVISVDTAVAHLAAAMGRPTIMLSQFNPCWRWWNIANGTGQPWYETMTIIRQNAPGQWADQVLRARDLLRCDELKRVA